MRMLGARAPTEPVGSLGHRAVLALAAGPPAGRNGTRRRFDHLLGAPNAEGLADLHDVRLLPVL